MLNVYLGGITWTVSSALVRGHGNFLFLLVGTGTIAYLLERLNNKHGFFKGYERSLMLVSALAVLQLIAYVGMWQTGFWTKMELIDLGTPAGNPNENIYWAFMKIVGLWYTLPYISRDKLKAPLRLDPRVLVW